MVVARSVQIDEISSTVESQPTGEGARLDAEGSAGGAVDAYAVARLVLDLMRADLRVEHERRSAGR